MYYFAFGVCCCCFLVVWVMVWGFWIWGVVLALSVVVFVCLFCVWCLVFLVFGGMGYGLGILGLGVDSGYGS